MFVAEAPRFRCSVPCFFLGHALVVETLLRARDTGSGASWAKEAGTVHGLLSPRLLLITFTGRKSGKAFTVPIRYVQEGDTLQIKVLAKYPWWEDLRGEVTVRVLLRGKTAHRQGRGVP